MSRLPAINLSKAELERFFELASDLMCILDATGCCKQANKAFARVLDYAAEDTCDRPLIDLAHPDDKANVQAIMSRLVATQSSDRFTCRYRCKTGAWCWLSWTVSVIAGEGQTQWLYCIARNVTRYKAETSEIKQFNAVLEGRVAKRDAQLTTAQEHYLKLVETERAAHDRAERASLETALYAEAVQNMPVGVYIWRLEDRDDAYSLRMIATNPATREFTGIPTQDLIGRSILETFPALADTQIPEIYANVVRTQQPYDLGEVHYGDDRITPSVFNVRAFPLADSCIGIAFENVTEYKRSEAIRREQAEQLAVIFQQAGVGMARLSPDGQWIQVNQRLCDMLGYTLDELLQKTFAEITHPDDAAIDDAIYQDLLSNKLAQSSIEKRYLTKEGEVVWAHVTASTVRDEQGEMLYFIATIQDITQRKQANLALTRQKDDLLTVNRLLTDTMAQLEQRNQELDQFAYVTSHDLKAPLRAIANLATWIEEDIGDSLPAENVEQFELLKNRVHRMEGLINGLLEYSRVGRKKQSRERVEVGQLLSEITDSLSPLGQFSIEIAPNMPTLHTRKVPLQQVFSNLINNAIKHHDRPDGKVQVQVRELKEFYEFAVSDDGPGIDAAYHEKIFTIFQTLKARDDLESTGIGLSIVKKTVEAEGGSIVLNSKLGEGTTFLFSWLKSSL